LVGGVDILDSEKFGLVVLEVNGWPDLYDIEDSTKLPIFEKLAETYVQQMQRFV